MPGPFVILGGGPCGLAAGWRLARAGACPLVLEREEQVGGLCATHEKNGWRFDLGGHRFVSSDAEISRWVQDLLGSDLLERERRSVVLHGGKQFRYPLEPMDLVRTQGLRDNAVAVMGYAWARGRRALRPEEEVNFEQWVTARFGRPLYNRFFGPYSQKLWGVHPSRISADWAAERISLLDLKDVALRLAGLRRSPTRTYARRYLYPRLGMGQLYRAMADEIVRRGGAVRTGARVIGLETEGRRVTAVRVAYSRGEERVPAEQVLSTVPLPELARYLCRGTCEPVARAAAALRFRALTFLHLMLRRADFSENTWMYVSTGELAMSRIQEPKRRSPAMVPLGRTSLLLEIPCDAGDATYRAPTDELRRRALRELSALGFAVDDVVDACSVRVEHGYPVYHIGYERDRRLLLRAVEGFENVSTAGRQGRFRYVFMDAAMRMGVLAAEQMLQGRLDGEEIDRVGRSSSVVETAALTA
jgi:protoporphyrinogen oxidase